MANKRETAETRLLDVGANNISRVADLAGLLQTSLEIESVLDYFLAAAVTHAPFSGARYTHAGLNVELEFGDAGRHACTYNLSLGEQDLGELTFSNARRLTVQHLTALENMLCHLVYPLRNALLYREARQAAQIDGLTGAYNRTALDAALPREIEMAHRHATDLSLVLLDVDHFKTINDTYGHKTGDQVLAGLASCVKEQIRGCDVFYRYGGEEFIVVLANTDRDGGCQVAERIRNAVANQTVTAGDKSIPVTVSIGVACLHDEDDGNALFERADKALYAAKAAGRNQTRCA